MYRTGCDKRRRADIRLKGRKKYECESSNAADECKHGLGYGECDGVRQHSTVGWHRVGIVQLPFWVLGERLDHLLVRFEIPDERQL